MANVRVQNQNQAVMELIRESIPVQKPRAWVVGFESDSHITTSHSRTNHISADRVEIVISTLSGAPDDTEWMLISKCQPPMIRLNETDLSAHPMKMNRMLEMKDFD